MRLRTDEKLLRDLRIARDLGVAPRRLWGWEPETRLVRDGDGWKLVTEPEYDKSQYELLAALHEHEASLDEYGHPLDESTSILADPLNPDGTHMYKAKAVRSWSAQAVVDAESDPKYSGENYNPARRWRVVKVLR